MCGAALSHSASVFDCAPSTVGVNEAVIVHEAGAAYGLPSTHVVLHKKAPLVQIAGPVQLPSRSALIT